MVHPDSPAGGAGPGVSRPPGPLGYSGMPSPMAHPDSPACRYVIPDIKANHVAVNQRIRAVYEALSSAPNYVPMAIYDATGQELRSIASGIVPGLLFFVGALATTTALGASAGAAVGVLAFGIGAVPGAAIGAGVGFDAGLILLQYLGLGFLVGYIGTSLLNAVNVAGEAVVMAWNSAENSGTRHSVIDRAARRLAFAVGLVFRGLLQGVVAFLLAKGTAAASGRVPELVSRLRASKLGSGFAQWIERTWRALIENPKLRTDTQRPLRGGGVRRSERFSPNGASPDRSPMKNMSEESEAKPAPRTPATLAEGFAERVRPAELRTAQRLAADYPEFDGRTFDAPPPPDPGYDWRDDLGHTYDAMGDGTKSQFFNLQQFTSSIDSHLLKGNDFTVIDMTGYTPEQIDAVSNYVNGLPASSRAVIRRVGF